MQESRPIVVGLGEILWDNLPAGRQLGGAPANFAYHATRLGANGMAASCVGEDPDGATILDRLKSVGVEPLISIDLSHPTGTVDVVLDSAGVPSYVIHQEVAWDYIPASAPLIDVARRCDAVCFGSLAQRSPVSRETIRTFLHNTPAKCLRVFDINLRQHYFSRQVIEESLAKAAVLKLNDQELPIVAKLLGFGGETIVDIPARLISEHSLQVVALTRGDGGSVLYTRDEVIEHPGFPTTVADTVGAGDAFTAALVTGLLLGHDLERISTFANRLASYVCSQHGAMPRIPAEILNLQ